MQFALRIEGRVLDTRLITQWEDPSPLSEREMLENLLLKRRIGLPVDRALIEAGYGAGDVEGMSDPEVGVDDRVLSGKVGIGLLADTELDT